MIYKYKVTYWDIITETDKADMGLVFGKNYGEAAMNVHDDYGADMVEDIYLQELEAAQTITVDEIHNILNEFQ